MLIILGGRFQRATHERHDRVDGRVNEVKKGEKISSWWVPLESHWVAYAEPFISEIEEEEGMS